MMNSRHGFRVKTARGQSSQQRVVGEKPVTEKHRSDLLQTPLVRGSAAEQKDAGKPEIPNAGER